jgi:Xaa-Pro dipeptidase
MTGTGFDTMLFNKSRAEEYMSRYGLDVLVATAPVNITYLSNYYCWLDAQFKEYMMVPGASSDLMQSYAVFPLEGEPALVVSPLFAVNAAGIWINDLYVFGNAGWDWSVQSGSLTEAEHQSLELLKRQQSDATATDALLSILSSRRLTNARIGLEMQGFSEEPKATIVRALPHGEVKDCTNIIRLIRMVKSPEELSRLTRAAEINECVSKESLSLARPGRNIQDLIHHYRNRVTEMGADFDHFAFGVRGMGIATEPDYVFKEDDLLYVDFGCIYERYFSDSGTTLALSTPPEPLLERHAAVRDCVAAAEGVIRPGMKASAVRNVMSNDLNQRSITASFPHGHGLGLELRDYPIIVANNELRIRDDFVNIPSDLPLEAGMVVNLEAAIFMPGVASVHIEKSLLVTATGNEPLVPQDRSRPVQPEFSSGAR